jgi:hypothetical protein
LNIPIIVTVPHHPLLCCWNIEFPRQTEQVFIFLIVNTPRKNSVHYCTAKTIARGKKIKKKCKKNKPCQPHQKTTLPILPKTFLNGVVVDCEALKGILKDSKP